jgi:serine O-acetyltransferase
MPKLTELLYDDLARQFELEGRSQLRPNVFRFLVRLLQFRYLPNVLCRTSRAAFLSGVPFIPNFLTYLNVVLFGLEVTPKCDIGSGVFFAHPVGTVVGASRIGRNVTFFQGVTIGAKTADMQFDPALRPVIGDNVVLGAGCKVLGGIELGEGVTVGANAVVTQSVAPYATVVGIPARVISYSVAAQSDRDDVPHLP